MSKEIQAGFPCPHLIIEESVDLDADRRSLYTSAPVSNSGGVRILVNDELYIPSSGLYTQASLYGGKGPFRVEKCSGLSGANGTLFGVETSVGKTEIFLPVGARISLSDMVKALRISAIANIALVSMDNDSLRITDTEKTGTSSLVKVHGRGANLLGFTQMGKRGNELFPPWEVVSKRDVYPASYAAGVTLVPAKYPRFVRPLQGNQSIKVTYPCMPERCSRCRATYVENDYKFDPTGEIITIQNENLLYQACLKAILTVKGSNPYHTGYGSRIMSRIGQKSTLLSASQIREDIVQALSNIQALQNGQRKYQQVTDKERLYRVSSVNVKNTQDPTTFLVDVVVVNGSNQPVSINITYTAPGAIALAGSNGKSLGTEAVGVQRILIGE